MEQLDKLIENNKVTIFDNGRLNEPLIFIDDRAVTMTDYIFNMHSYKDEVIDIKSHIHQDWFSITVNTHIQRLKRNSIHDLEADLIDMRIKLTPLEIIDEISENLRRNFELQVVGDTLNVLQDYSIYIDFIISENLADYTRNKELLFIETEEDTDNVHYHFLKIQDNQLKTMKNEIIDIEWFINTVGIFRNELKLLTHINTSFI